MRKRVVNRILRDNLGKNEVRIFMKGRENSICLGLNEPKIKYDYQFYDWDNDVDPFDLLKIIKCENGKAENVICLNPEEINYIYISYTLKRERD